jgi:hypothetical protein
VLGHGGCVRAARLPGAHYGYTRVPSLKGPVTAMLTILLIVLVLFLLLGGFGYSRRGRRT